MISISAKDFYQMILLAKEELEKDSEEINNLNVFPVPDGDTGSNMSMTMSGVTSVTENDAESVGGLSKAIADGMLRSARGNSGVILSVFFRGIAKGLIGKNTADARDMVAAFENGVLAAYGAVMNPTEGTILTVMRSASEAGRAAIEEDPDIEIEPLFDKMVSASTRALKETPELLPMLKQAGVVDAGGCGFLTILSTMTSAVKHEKALPTINYATMAKPTVTSAAANADFDARYPYCTECIVEKNETYAGEDKAGEFKSFILSAGDSAVFVEDSEIIKIHVHTSDPGSVLTEAIKYGSLLTIKVENMEKQHSELTLVPAKRSFAKPFGFVAVSNGDGICDIFSDLGVDNLVIGGQTMNPSTEDMLAAIEATDAETVYVFPNNSNIIMVSEQAADIAGIDGKNVVVIRTKSIPQGIAALYAFEPELDTEHNTAAMSAAISMVKSLSVTYAVRDADIDNIHILEGQYLGLVENKVKKVTNTLEACIEELAYELIGCDIVTLFYGEDVDEASAEKYKQIIADKLGEDIDLTLVSGGQPVYSFIISGE